MIDRKRLLALDYYKKEHFSGSDSERNMRYRIERYVPPVPEDTAEGGGDAGVDAGSNSKSSAAGASSEPVFRATIWPEPYSYEATDPGLFITHDEPFCEEGLCALVDWMNTRDFL